ncbi:MAG: magnesium transporter [Halobacteriales archaeon]
MPEQWTVRSISRAMLPTLAALTLLEIVGSGLLLDSIEASLLSYPSLLVLVPVTIGTAGAMGSILASRLSTTFHLGMLRFEPGDEVLLGNALAALALAVTLFPAVGLGAWALTALAGSTTLPATTVLAVATASGVTLAALAVIVTLVATYAAYRLGLDPDDVVIPVVTNVCDVLGVFVLFVAVQVLV